MAGEIALQAALPPAARGDGAAAPAALPPSPFEGPHAVAPAGAAGVDAAAHPHHGAAAHATPSSPSSDPSPLPSRGVSWHSPDSLVTVREYEVSETQASEDDWEDKKMACCSVQ